MRVKGQTIVLEGSPDHRPLQVLVVAELESESEASGCSRSSTSASQLVRGSSTLAWRTQRHRLQRVGPRAAASVPRERAVQVPRGVADGVVGWGTRSMFGLISAPRFPKPCAEVRFLPGA